MNKLMVSLLLAVVCQRYDGNITADVMQHLGVGTATATEEKIHKGKKASTGNDDQSSMIEQVMQGDRAAMMETVTAAWQKVSGKTE